MTSMNHSVNLKVIILACLTLAGCAATPPIPLNTSIQIQKKVNANNIEIDDYAVDRKAGDSSGSVYYTGWAAIPDSFVKPAFHTAFSQKLKSALQPITGANGTIQIAIIESGFFMDSKATDTVVFIGIAAAFRERPYKCNVTLNLKVGGKSERHEFEHVQLANRAFGDLDNKQEFINNCQNALVEKVANFISTQ